MTSVLMENKKNVTVVSSLFEANLECIKELCYLICNSNITYFLIVAHEVSQNQIHSVGLGLGLRVWSL